MKNKIIPTLLLNLSLLLLLPGCNLINGIFNNQSQISQVEPKWDEIKVIIKRDVLNTEDLNKIHNQLILYYKIKASDIEELLKIYNQTKYDYVKQFILKVINNTFSNIADSADSTASSSPVSEDASAIAYNEKILNLYKSIARSNNSRLSPLALRGLMEREGGSSSQKWQNWGWSEEVVSLLEEAVNKNLYSLSRFSYYELLALANKYPNSLFTKGCKEYVNFTGGIYFDGLSGHGNSVFRQPFNPQREIEFWSKFLNKYPGHPASDDALYRLARAYELQGDYENAIFHYYEASQAPDGNLSSVAKERILFIIDLLMSSDQLAKFLNHYPNHPLFPYIIYTRAVHLIRESQYSVAASELNIFFKKYQNFPFENLVDYYYNSEKPYIDSTFWGRVKQQIEQVEELKNIRNKPQTEKILYQEAKFWIDDNKKINEYPTYNQLWGGNMRFIFEKFVPEWKGNTTYTDKLVTYELINIAKQSYASQIFYLRSITLFKKILKESSNSELSTAAKYSIGVAYYYLWRRDYPVFSEDVISWKDMAINIFEEFVKEFPNSSMADDALFSIAFIQKYSSESEPAFATLQRLLREYPNGDTKDKAEEMMKNFEGKD